MELHCVRSNYYGSMITVTVILRKSDKPVPITQECWKFRGLFVKIRLMIEGLLGFL